MTSRTEVEGLRKAQIMKATRDVVCEKGFDKTTMRDIGSRAGMSAAIVCYYFDDKKRLMRETLMEACLVHRAFILAIIDRADLSPADKLDLVVEDTLPIDDEQRKEWRFWLDYWAESARDEDLRIPVAETNVRFRGHIERILEQGVASGVFRGDIPAADLARDLAAMIDGYSTAMILDPENITKSMVKAAVRRRVAPC
jgi:AcrR family transcriptional regulator